MKKKNKKRKIRKRDRGEESALFRIHKNFEDSSLLLKKVREQIQINIDSGKLRGKVKEKMEAFVLLTTEVDKMVSAYDALLKEYFNIEDVAKGDRYDTMVQDFYDYIVGTKTNPFTYDHDYIVQKVLCEIVGGYN